MTPFTPKTYQQQVLDSVQAYFTACHELPSPSLAFTATTERLWGRGNPYHALVGFPADMPYFCLRVPTGGGKTWLTDLLRRDGFTLARVNLQKFLIRNLIEARIRELRKQAVGKAYQQTLFGDDAASRVAVSDQYVFEFHALAYAPSRDYDGRFGHFDFRKHFYGRIGDFDSKEEFECACQLDMWAQQGRIQFWVRNLVRREGCSFFLQKADGRFYPDFLCQLPDVAGQPGPILAVEYKGADRWNGAENDRLIGGLWANLSEGRCRFVMVTDRRWDWIEAQLNRLPVPQR